MEQAGVLLEAIYRWIGAGKTQEFVRRFHPILAPMVEALGAEAALLSGEKDSLEPCDVNMIFCGSGGLLDVNFRAVARHLKARFVPWSGVRAMEQDAKLTGGDVRLIRVALTLRQESTSQSGQAMEEAEPEHKGQELTLLSSPTNHCAAVNARGEPISPEDFVHVVAKLLFRR